MGFNPSKSSTDRFPIRSDKREDGSRHTVHTISCCNCPNEAIASTASGGGAMGTEMLVRRFTRLGWYVGRSAGSHICPDCNTTRQRAAPEPVEDPIPVKDKPFSSALTADKIGPSKSMQEAAEKIGAKQVSKFPDPGVPLASDGPVWMIPKRELSFADRRIINAKLEEVYENELIGYKKDWSDFRVSEDLGIIEAWVVEVRAANFGPAAGNEAVVQLRREVDLLRDKHADWKRIGDGLVDDIQALEKRLAALGS